LLALDQGMKALHSLIEDTYAMNVSQFECVLLILHQMEVVLGVIQACGKKTLKNI